MIILDASAAIELLLGTETGAAVRRRVVADRVLGAPHLLDVEVGQALRRFERGGAIDGPRALAALADLGDLVTTRYPHTALLPRMWELRANLTLYDAAYVALAEALSSRLVTCDAKLAGTPGHRARVELVPR